MWESVRMLSETLQEKLTKEEYADVERDMYYSMVGGHYNEQYAHEDVAQMYYERDGKKWYAPYWTDQQVEQVYNNVRDKIPSEYNMWDFYVALNMVKSDNCNLFRHWWQGAEDTEIEKKVVEATVNYLDDPDNPYGTEKVWCYLN